MTKIIAVLNHKGGVGKTTTTINLAAALQQKKKRVLAIDMDGQANLTESFGLSIEEEQTVYGAMKGKYPLPLVETAGGVTVVPSCLDLSAAEAELINEPGRELILSGLIAKSLDHRKFDYILIDCPPSLGLLTLNALTAADYLIIPVQAQFLAMRGMAKIMNVIATVQERLNPKLAIGGIVITQFDKRKTLNKSVAELVKDSFCDKVFKTVIRDNVSLAEAPIKGKNIFEYSKNSNGAKDYMALAQEVLKLNNPDMSKSDLLKDSMKGGLDGLLSSTKKSTGGKQPVAAPTEKETAVHCNFVINKSIHTRMKFLAIKKNMSLKDIVNEAMKEYLEKNEQ